MSISNYYQYPKWAGVSGRWHATMYISPEQPADVVSYGTRVIQGRRFPVVKFTGFGEEDLAGALSLARLAEAMKIIINHAAKSSSVFLFPSKCCQSRNFCSKNWGNFIFYILPFHCKK